MTKLYFACLSNARLYSMDKLHGLVLNAAQLIFQLAASFESAVKTKICDSRSIPSMPENMTVYISILQKENLLNSSSVTFAKTFD